MAVEITKATDVAFYQCEMYCNALYLGLIAF